MGGPYREIAQQMGSVGTAAEIAAVAPAVADRSTPMAEAAEHRLRLVEARRARQPFPRPARTRVMVVANQKGGVGKTTTAVNLSAALALHGLKVLVVDLDPQGNASTALSVDHPSGAPSTYDVVLGDRPLADVAVKCAHVDGLWVAPATIDLAGAEMELVGVPERENTLSRPLERFLGDHDGSERFDYVLIDCPPSLGLLTVNALVAGREMLIPIQCEYYALEGLGQLVDTVDRVRRHLNPGLAISTIVLTMYDGRTRLAAAVADEVRTYFGSAVLRTLVPRSVRISEAPSYGQTVMTYDPGSPGAMCYLQVASELTSRAAPARKEWT